MTNYFNAFASCTFNLIHRSIGLGSESLKGRSVELLKRRPSRPLFPRVVGDPPPDDGLLGRTIRPCSGFDRRALTLQERRMAGLALRCAADSQTLPEHRKTSTGAALFAIPPAHRRARPAMRLSWSVSAADRIPKPAVLCAPGVRHLVADLPQLWEKAGREGLRLRARPSGP